MYNFSMQIQILVWDSFKRVVQYPARRISVQITYIKSDQ